MYQCAQAGTARDLAAQVSRDRDWVPYGPPRFHAETFYQLQVKADNHAPLAQALRDMASNCPTTSTRAEKLMSAAAATIINELNPKNSSAPLDGETPFEI